MNVIFTYFATETATATDTERWESGVRLSVRSLYVNVKDVAGISDDAWVMRIGVAEEDGDFYAMRISYNPRETSLVNLTRQKGPNSIYAIGLRDMFKL